jgi:hypothetical protein
MNAVRLMVVGNSMEAETICGLLRTEGIACDHRHTDVGAGAGDIELDGRDELDAAGIAEPWPLEDVDERDFFGGDEEW